LTSNCLLRHSMGETVTVGKQATVSYQELENRESFLCSRMFGEDERIPQNLLVLQKKFYSLK